jgi:aminodeoxyfutalosine synthase
MLRELQDDTGGFLAYIPLAYHPDDNELGIQLGRRGSASTGFDDLRNLAVGRLYLDNIAHIKTHWIMVTPFLSQTALSFGVNDMEGTVVREKIYHAVGAHTPQAMTLDEIVKLIRGAKKVPAERDSFYNVLRTFPPDAPVDAPDRTAAAEAA